MACLEFRVLPTLVSSTEQDVAATPCFFSQVCFRRAAIEKAGRSVCRECAGRLRGAEYPLRDASLQPLYLTGRDAAEALDMTEDRSSPVGAIKPSEVPA